MWGGRAMSGSAHPTDEDVFLVASESGGLFRTDNGGQVWLQVSGDITYLFEQVLFLPSDGNIALAVAKRDTRTMSGGGIYRSTDAGQTWEKAIMTFFGSNLCQADLGGYSLTYSASTGRIYAGTTCGIFFSDTQGETWFRLANQPTGRFGSLTIFAIKVDPEDQDRMVILTTNRVYRTTDGGANWEDDQGNLPDARWWSRYNRHNQIAISPLNQDHLFLSGYYADTLIEDSVTSYSALWFSADFGGTWRLLDSIRPNREPIIQLTRGETTAGSPTTTVYFADGGCGYKRQTLTVNELPDSTQWERVEVDHCDGADFCFASDGFTPQFLLSDGGIHATTDGGSSWTSISGASTGYTALQITEVVTQMTYDDEIPNLIFGTQDNNIWASTDYGESWPNPYGPEGFHLTLPLADVDGGNIHTGTACGPCENYVTDNFLENESVWTDPPRHDFSSPTLVRPGTYLQTQVTPDSTQWELLRTTNQGAEWTITTLLDEWPDPWGVTGYFEDGLPLTYIVTSTDSATLPSRRYYEAQRFLHTPSGVVVPTSLPGLGNLGTTPTMFTRLRFPGVNPNNPHHIIAADMEAEQVKVTNNGGITWRVDSALTRLVTDNGNLRFSWNSHRGIRNSKQMTTVAWNPYCEDHILVGTMQSGIIESTDGGDTWQRVEGSEQVPYITSFAFPYLRSVVFSSYGRGLWRYAFECGSPGLVLPEEINDRVWPDEIPPIPSFLCYAFFSNLEDVKAYQQSEWGALITQGGNIVDVQFDEATGVIRSVQIDGGSVAAYDALGVEITPPFTISTATGSEGNIDKYEYVGELKKRNRQVKGLCFQGNKYSGLIMWDQDLNPELLPKEDTTTRPSLRAWPMSPFGYTAEELTKVKLQGRGFTPSTKLALYVDDEVVREGITVEDNGAFWIPVPVQAFGEFSSYVEVRQLDDEKGKRAGTLLSITVSDHD
ncbi:MAG TPA: hypothetical protein DCE41_31125 [Cytophagales bacterium]|nr:hypothetical protein [Cytophagales bacterium]HAA20421.1 hypothetical protein [Cytophagales bacterium]HAP58358.1 hypothetical protein [Cytophagales bacterium]